MHDYDAGILGTVYAAEFCQQIFFVVSQFTVHHDHGPGAMIAGVDRLGNQLGVLRQSGIPALCRETCRLVAQDHDDLVFYVQMRVIVITEFRSRRAIARKYDRTVNFTRRGKAEGDKILIQFQFLPGFAVRHLQAISLF